MILVKPSFEILAILAPYAVNDPLHLIELAGRTCYKSEGRMDRGTAKKFVRMIRDRGHHSVIEHSAVTVKIVCDRGVTHELVRHRLAAYSQESTRYCNYKGGVTFIIPPWMLEICVLGRITGSSFDPMEVMEATKSSPNPVDKWLFTMAFCETAYINLVDDGWTPQQARSVLPNSLKTEIVVTANLREWLHIFTLRCSKAAHPQMREIMIPLCREFQRRIPVIFDEVRLGDATAKEQESQET